MKKKIIYYYTSAFKWHNKLRMHINQTQDLMILIEEILAVKNVKLIIKKHPKDTIEKDILKKIDNNKIVIDNKFSLEKDLNNGDIFFANISTIIAESLLLGFKIHPLIISFNKVLLQNSFINFIPQKIIYRKEDLKSFIKNIDNYNPIHLGSQNVIFKSIDSSKKIIKIIEQC